MQREDFILSYATELKETSIIISTLPIPLSAELAAVPMKHSDIL